jgi:hypothetical protein
VRALRLTALSATLLLLCLTSCPMKEGCVSVTVTNLTGERIAISATECWSAVVHVDPNKSVYTFVLPGETVEAVGETSGAKYYHIFARDNDLWEIK